MGRMGQARNRPHRERRLMQISEEMAAALYSEVRLIRFAIKHAPDTPVCRYKDCGCMGPLPECRCMKRERMISEFMARIEKED